MMIIFRSALSCLAASILVGCATSVNVAKREDLFSAQRDRKECYTYDTLSQNMARNAPASVGLGIIGGIFPPLWLLTAVAAGASAAADVAALPVRCGLTAEDAVKEAWAASHYQKTTSMWWQKGGPLSISAKYVEPVGEDCSTHELTILRNDDGISKKFSEFLKVCRDSEGLAVLQ
jgi:hypothetical protein